MFTEEDKEAMINLIEWYRDECHRSDWCHSKMIETIKTTNDEDELLVIEGVIDSWID